jgi:predicted deacylase
MPRIRRGCCFRSSLLSEQAGTGYLKGEEVHMVEKVAVGPVIADRGSHAFGFLPITTAGDGGNIGIGVHVLAGHRPGPKLVVMATSHGQEYRQISSLMQLVEEIDPAVLVGDLVLVPVQNPVAFEMGSRGSWIDGLWGDSGNMNRVWPGRENGWLTERFAHAMVRDVFPDSTVIMDLHAPTREFHLSYGYLGKGEPGDLSYDIPRAFGQEMLMWNSPEELVEKGQSSTTAMAYASSQGYVTYGGEIGEFHGLGVDRDQHSAEELYRGVPEVGFTGITNVMKYLGMIEGELKLPPRQIRVTPELNLRPNHGGLLISNVGVEDLGTVIPGGTVLGRVISPYSFEVLDEIVAPFEESILTACHYQKPFDKVLPGEFVYLVGDNKRTEEVPPLTTHRAAAQPPA